MIEINLSPTWFCRLHSVCILTAVNSYFFLLFRYLNSTNHIFTFFLKVHCSILNISFFFLIICNFVTFSVGKKTGKYIAISYMKYILIYLRNNKAIVTIGTNRTISRIMTDLRAYYYPSLMTPTIVVYKIIISFIALV